MTAQVAPSRLARPDGSTIAYHATPGKTPGVLFCGGFKSDMTGTKAIALEAACRRAGRAYVRFDYFGHGQSDGAFVDATVGRWRDDTLAVIDAATEGPLVVVGSSMGGWMMLHAALARPGRVGGLVGIAPAPDFTEMLLWPNLPEAAKTSLKETGVWRRPSAYSPEPYEITMRLIEEGRHHLVLDRLQAIECPVRLLHGMKDPDVPWQHSVRLMEALKPGADATLTLIKDGDHRLSTEADIARLVATVETLCEEVSRACVR